MTTVVAPDPVVRFGYDLGLPGVALEFPRAHRLFDAPRAGLGGWHVRALAHRLGSDVLYANGTRAFPYGVAARVMGGPPLVAHHHGILTTGPIGVLVRGLQHWANQIVVPSFESARPFEPSKKVRVVRNGVDLTHYRSAPDRQRDPKVVGTVARFAPGKGLESFIRVAQLVQRSHSETNFLLTGGPAFPGAQPLLEGVKGLTMTGYLRDPLSAYQSIDVFLHLSEPEAFPLTALEAMACSLPVVAYRWGGVAEIFEDGVNGFLVEPRDEATVAARATTLLEDEQLRRRIGSAARATCEARFALERMAAEISDVVHQASR